MGTTRYELLDTEYRAAINPDDDAMGGSIDDVFEEALLRVARPGASYSWPDRASKSFYVED